MAVNFPTDPQVGDEVTANSATLKWDGVAWVSSGSSGTSGNADIADFVFDYASYDQDESRMTIHNHDMVIRTTRDSVPEGDEPYDADISIDSANDMWIDANDEIAITSSNDTVRIGTWGVEGPNVWRFTQTGSISLPAGDSSIGSGTSGTLVDETRTITASSNAQGTTDDFNGSAIMLSITEDTQWFADQVNSIATVTFADGTTGQIDSIYDSSSQVGFPSITFGLVDSVNKTFAEMYPLTIVGEKLRPKDYVSIDVNKSTWKFEGDGDLVTPTSNARIINTVVPGDITLSAYSGITLSFADVPGAGLTFPDQTIQTTAYTGEGISSFPYDPYGSINGQNVPAGVDRVVNISDTFSEGPLANGGTVGLDGENAVHVPIDDEGFQEIFDNRAQLNGATITLNDQTVLNVTGFAEGVYQSVEFPSGQFILETGITKTAEEIYPFTFNAVHIYPGEINKVQITSYNDVPGVPDPQFTFSSDGTFRLPGDGYIQNVTGSSGDGYGNDTIEIVPDSSLTSDQRIIIDPTQPNHIHIRPGGIQDGSTAELIIGGERTHVKVADNSVNYGGSVNIASKVNPQTGSYVNDSPEAGPQMIVSTTDLGFITPGTYVYVNGTKHYVSDVSLNSPLEGQSIITVDGATLIPNDHYTFISDQGENNWSFTSNGMLVGPAMGYVNVYGIANPATDTYLGISAAHKITISGTDGEFLGDPEIATNQIATLGDLIPGVTGPQGPGFGVSYLGNYNSEAGYVPDIAVVRGSDGQLYLAKASGQLGDPINYQNNGQWEVWIPKGADGAQGATGEQGPTGAGVPTGGSAGQILAKTDTTDYNTEWIDNYTSQVKHLVKAGESLTAGQAVYVSSATGTNIVVSKASNATEATSSKVLGLIAQDMALNDTGFVVTEGLIAGLDTGTANEGDAVWLGTSGNLIYGLANKPHAPAHLVFIGVVTRANTNNGEIFVKVQNGFELEELHTVSLEATASIADNEVLAFDSASGLWKNKTASEAGLATAADFSNTAWTSYTPVVIADGGGFSLGNGVVTGRYKQIGKTVSFYAKFIFGSTTSPGAGHWNFSLPVQAYDSNFTFSAAILDDGAAWYGGIGNGNYTGSKTHFAVIIPGTSASVTTWATVGNGGPFIWTDKDNITISGTYEAAQPLI